MPRDHSLLILFMLICLSSYLRVIYLNFTVVSNKWSLGIWKGNYFGVWNSLFMTAVITLPVSLSPHSSGLCCKQRGKNYKFRKLHYPLEQDYGLKKISYFQKINLQVCMFWQGPHLAKYASKGIYIIRKMVTFLFVPFLWPLWSVFAIQLHVIFYTFGHQPS